MKDLIVVGAGPAGSELSRKMSEKGLDVEVIERSDEIGKPLACSGHVSPDIWDFVDDSERILQNRIKGAHFHPDNSNYRFYSQETVSFVIDRIELDRYKAEESMEAGTTYSLGEEVKEVTEEKDHVAVETDSRSIKAKMVAGCDGASSKVREEVGLPEPDHFYQGVLCFSDEDDGGDFVDVYTDVPEFFGWRIPRGDSVEYGAAVPQGESTMKWLERVVDEHTDMEETRNVCAGAIPVGPPESVSTDRVFLVGDAAAQTKPFTGGGILYGMRCADVAASSVDLDDPESLDVYEEEWREELGREIWLGSMIESMYSAPQSMQKLGMWMFQGEISVHMDHPTSLFSIQQLKSLVRRD